MKISYIFQRRKRWLVVGGGRGCKESLFGRFSLPSAWSLPVFNLKEAHDYFALKKTEQLKTPLEQNKR